MAAASQLKIGTLVDKLYAINQKIDAANAVVTKLKGEREKIEEAIFSKFSKADIEGARGSTASVSVSERVFYNVEDYKKLENFIYRNRALDLMQKRLSSTAINDRLEAGKTVPGITAFRKMSLSVKARKK